MKKALAIGLAAVMAVSMSDRYLQKMKVKGLQKRT